MKPHQPHDKFFKSFFANKQHANGLLSGVLPPSLLEKCDLNTLSLDTTSYVDEHLKTHFADLVYSCKLKNKRKIYFTFLLEHKTTPSAYPHLQLLRYFLNIWEKEVKQRKPLSVIIPVIIYHGRRRWEAKPFESYFSLRPDKDTPDLLPYLPVFSYLLTDLSQTDKAFIKESFQLKNVRMALMLMKHIYRQLTPELMSEIFEGLDKLLEREEGENFYRQILVYLFSTTDQLQYMEILDQLSKAPEKSKKIRMTIAEQLERKGMEKGIEQGMEKGIEKGMEKGIEKGMEKGMEKGIEKGMEKGIAKRNMELAQNMKNKGYSAEEVHSLTGLSPDQIKDL